MSRPSDAGQFKMYKKQQNQLIFVLSLSVLVLAGLTYYLLNGRQCESTTTLSNDNGSPSKPSNAANRLEVEKDTRSGNAIPSKQVKRDKVAFTSPPPRPQQTSSFLVSLRNKPLSEIIPVDNESLTISVVDAFNNVHLAPRFQAIADMDYFRFVKLNLKNKCQLWTDNTKCALR